jgi:hypothetical protein
MPRYRVRADVTYYVDLPSEEAVYDHADDADLADVNVYEVYVRDVDEDPT